MKRYLCLAGLMSCSLCNGTWSWLVAEPGVRSVLPGETAQFTFRGACNTDSSWAVELEPREGFQQLGTPSAPCAEPIVMNLLPASTTAPGEYVFGVRGVTHSGHDSHVDTTEIRVIVLEPTSVGTRPGLDVTISGVGKVTADGIDCGAGSSNDCSNDFEPGTRVTLTATGTEQRFTQWSGHPDCEDGEVVIGTGRTRCTATFSIGGQMWRALGPPLNVFPASVGSDISGITIEPGGDGLPVAAWRENGEVHVARWSGAAWVALGGKLNDGPAVSAPSLTTETGGNLVVAWEENAGADGSNVYAARLPPSTTTWERLNGGDPFDTTVAESASAPCVRLGYPGELVIAWSETLAAGGSRIVVKKSMGNSWVNAATDEGPPRSGTETATSPRLAFVGPRLTPTLTVAWVQNGTSVRVAERQGAWLTSPTPAFTGLTSAGFDLATGSDGAMVTALPPIGMAQFQVKQVNTGLVSNAGPPRGTAGGSDPMVRAIALSHVNGGSPGLAWSYRVNDVERVFVELWSAGTWSPIGGPVTPVARAGDGAVALQVALTDSGSHYLLLAVSSFVNGTPDMTLTALEFK
ncbi:MAG: exo-alpha-sialidase [Myxococcaceae bacterium]|nr:exo-alpha-sialidase [Myxococcaceae bacterium]